MGISVEQKFLVSGHTQMEYDPVHSVIERKIWDLDVYIPSDYRVAISVARMNRFRYTAEEVVWTDRKKLSREFLKSVRPGKKRNDPTVSDVCAYRYTDTDISYKLSWRDSWTSLPCRLNVEEKSWIPMFPNRPTITARKFDDLQSLRHVVPDHVHNFYSQLPTS